MENEATESITDPEAVQWTMDTINKTISIFWEADMRTKLKDCLKVQVISYQHQEIKFGISIKMEIFGVDYLP